MKVDGSSIKVGEVENEVADGKGTVGLQYTDRIGRCH